MQIIDKAVMPDGTQIQLEDLSGEHKLPNYDGLVIVFHTIAKKTFPPNKGWYAQKGKEFHSCICCYKNYTCLIYAWNNGYESILECDDDLKIFDCLDSVTEEIYDEFIERTKDENGETDTEYFMKWVNEENWDERNRK